MLDLSDYEVSRYEKIEAKGIINTSTSMIVLNDAGHVVLPCTGGHLAYPNTIKGIEFGKPLYVEGFVRIQEPYGKIFYADVVENTEVVNKRKEQANG